MTVVERAPRLLARLRPLQDIVKLPLLLLLSKLLYLNPLSSGKPSLVHMTDLARAVGRELTTDVREMPRDGIETLTTIEWNSPGWRALRLKLYGEKRYGYCPLKSSLA
ncbi:hypothetical protein Salat_2577500 [Sesamum alatum]|uniref:Uncharacterized protein n=1 Tax=Sesamum alatum TaxID=300844 RepID=A0AAE1XNQ1_9LAMI|nr:hypothetical protein Salat_2577500 [Sesamum alatum]